MSEKSKNRRFMARGKCMIDVLEYHPEASLVAVCDKYRPLLDEVAQSAEKADIEVVRPL